MIKVRFYSDLLNDDFAGTNIDCKPIDDNFKYESNNIFFKLGSFILYRLIARPILYLFIKIHWLHTFKNKKVLKKCKHQGYFIYGNHTLVASDAYIPNIMHVKKKNYIIVNPDATSIKGVRTIVMMMGAIPLPNTAKSAINFKDKVKNVIDSKNTITIYPEAHIWPHYTDIRPFNELFLTYQVELNAPAYAFVNVAVKRKVKFIKRPKIRTYIVGPFYPDEELSFRERKLKLRDQIFAAMKAIVDKTPTYKYKYDYVYKEKNDMVN